MPPMAAMSERLAQTALAPRDQGLVVFRLKWTLSMSRSQVLRMSQPGVGDQTEASSPMPVRNEAGGEGNRRARSRMNPNSPSFPSSMAALFLFVFDGRKLVHAR